MTTEAPERTEVTEAELSIIDEIAPYVDDDSPHRKTHIINPPDNPHISNGFPGMEAQQVVNIARALRIEIVALCGFRFIPQHNPDKYDACEACIKIAGEIMRSEGE